MADIVVLKRDVSGGRRIFSGDAIDQCAFAGAVWADDCNEFAGSDRE